MSATKNINIEKISGLAKTNLSATISPTSTDDINAGYGVGSFWIDTATDKVYFCTDATVGSAVWIDVSSSGSISDGDKGDITVSSSGATWMIDDSVITLAKMADVSTSTVFYRKTGGTGTPEVQTLATLKTDLGLTGTNSGDQTITLTNDVTGSGTGSFATTISNDAVTNAKLANMAQTTIKGRASGSGTGDPTDLSASQVLDIIKTVDGTGSGLDADLLDGQQGSYYYPASNPNGYISSVAFNDLTNKTSGTGEYSTSGTLESGRGSGGVALTVNDGGGNANVTFNHKGRTPEQTGNAGRIDVNTDATSGARMRFGIANNLSAGVAVNLTNVMDITETDVTVLGGKVLTNSNAALSKTFTLEAPTASDDITIFRTDVAITVQEVIAVSVGTSPSTTYRLRHHTDRNNTGNLLTTLAATTSTTTGNVATLSDATIPANSWIWFESTAASGTNVKLTIDIRYTID